MQDFRLNQPNWWNVPAKIVAGILGMKQGVFPSTKKKRKRDFRWEVSAHSKKIKIISKKRYLHKVPFIQTPFRTKGHTTVNYFLSIYTQISRVFMAKVRKKSSRSISKIKKNVTGQRFCKGKHEFSPKVPPISGAFPPTLSLIWGNVAWDNASTRWVLAVILFLFFALRIMNKYLFL